MIDTFQPVYLRPYYILYRDSWGPLSLLYRCFSDSFEQFSLWSFEPDTKRIGDIQPWKSTSSTSVASLSNLRGITKASITRLSTKLRQLEFLVHDPSTFELAQQLVPNLNSLDARFKEQHFSTIDLIDEGDETTLAKEQEVSWRGIVLSASPYTAID